MNIWYVDKATEIMVDANSGERAQRTQTARKWDAGQNTLRNVGCNTSPNAMKFKIIHN
jgi:hypothetical protein